MIFAAPLDSPEGPISLPDGSLYCVEMGAESGCITHISSNGKDITRLARTGRPNGLAMDHDGTLWIAESSTPSLLRRSPDGKIDLWLTECNHKKFIFPNDLAFGPDGLLYMTDSGINTYQLAPDGKIRADYRTLSYNGRVYQIDTHDRTAIEIDSGLQFANGIAFGPDGNLYVNETITGNVYTYSVDGQKVGRRTLFGNVNDPKAPPGWRGPDGMKFGQDGNLYCTVYGQKDITVLDQNGRVDQRIETMGRFPTNLVFGYGSQNKIYITEAENHQIEVINVNTYGFKLFTSK
jgi:gluconolactonase